MAENISDIESSDSEFSDEDRDVDNDSEWDSDDEVPLSQWLKNIDLTPNWIPYTDKGAEFRKFPFTVPRSGFLIDADDRPKNELEYFQLFFTNELLQEIVTATNEYANKKINQKRPLQQHSIWHSWQDVSLIEMRAFLGVILNMALNPKPELVDFFSEDWISKMPFFKDVFSRERFLQIFWMLHLPEGTSLNQKPGSKTHFLCDYINRKCREHFVPYVNISLDESTVGFKGRVQWKCYNPKKPTKWGLRIYCLCDTVTGYIYCFIVYYGQTTTDGLIRPDLPVTSRIVLQLTDMLLTAANGSGFHIYTDRFYTSPNLALELRNLFVHTTGTVQTNRQNFPLQLKNIKLSTYEVQAYHLNSQVMALCFYDKRIVSMISTYHKPTVESVTRVIKRGVSETFCKPNVIIDYTKHMGGVDKADHYCGSYAFTRKSLKWWRKLFFWLVEVSIVNSYHLYSIDRNERNLSEVSHLKFRRELINQLVEGVRNKSRKRGRPSRTDQEERLNGKPHFIIKKPRKSHKDCAVCSKRNEPGGRHETSYFCETCSRQPGLHPGICFKKYHTQKIYK